MTHYSMTIVSRYISEQVHDVWDLGQDTGSWLGYMRLWSSAQDRHELGLGKPPGDKGQRTRDHETGSPRIHSSGAGTRVQQAALYTPS